MKTYEIKTSKGEFVVVESYESLVTRNTPKLFDFQTNIHVINGVKYECICKLSQATEDDAKLIVDEYLYNTNSEEGDCEVYEDYTTGDICFTSPLESLHSLIKSKGIDINNGNWYLFKKT